MSTRDSTANFIMVGKLVGMKHHRACFATRFFDLKAALANIQMPEDFKPQKPPGRPRRSRRPTAPTKIVTWLTRTAGNFRDEVLTNHYT